MQEEPEHEVDLLEDENAEKNATAAKRLNMKKMLLFSILLSSNIGGRKVLVFE